MIDDESLKNIQQLHELKNQGVITDDEFERAKEKLLFGTKAKAPKVIRPITATEFDSALEWVLLPLNRYAEFNGRSTRKEFWMFQLCLVAVAFVTVVLAAVSPDGGAAFAIIAMLGLAVPQMAVEVRRFHDQDRSGWFVLLNFIPYIGWLIVLGMMLLEGTPGGNRFGSDPRQGS